jgi:hypothetical protein
MWELICRETYDPAFFGLPFDSSGYRNHGKPIDVETFADGAAPRSGITRFAHPDSAVQITRTPEWTSLLALRIDCKLRLNGPASDVRVIAAGEFSFQFQVRPDGELQGSIFTYLPDAPFQGVQSGQAGQSGYLVPVGEWVDLSFVHDGVQTITLLADGAVVAQRSDIVRSVAGVGPAGVSIGNATLPGYPLNGDIDEISIWRFHPQSMWHDFISWPIGPDALQCWQGFLDHLLETLARHPDCMRKLMAALGAAFDDALNAIRAKGTAALQDALSIYQKYLQLWQAGEIDTPAMAQVVADWFAFLGAQGISLQGNPQLVAFLNSPCFRQIVEESRGFDCDPQFMALIGFALDSMPMPKSAT